MDYSEMIGAYLAGELNPQQRQAFEAELAANPELKEEVRDVRLVRLGVSAADYLEAGHVSAEQLLRYAENSDEFDNHTRAEIRNHLDQCEFCRQEVDLCRNANLEVEKVTGQRDAPAEPEARWLERLLSFLFPARLVLKTAYAYGSVAAIVIVLFVGYNTQDSDGPEWETYQLSSGETRDAATNSAIQSIEVSRNHGYVLIEIPLDLKTTCRYRYELTNDKTGSMPITPFVRDSNPIALLLPFSYLAEGTNSLRVVELRQAGETHKPETFNIEFLVQFTD